MIKYIKTWFNYTTNCFARGLIRCMKIHYSMLSLVTIVTWRTL